MTLLSQAIAWRRAFQKPMLQEIASDLDQVCAVGALQQRLIAEESTEADDASIDFWDEAAESSENLLSFLESDCGKDSREHLLKELADIVFVAYQYAAFMGMDLDTAMQRVFESNMSKLDDDGKPVLGSDGKVLKGPNYRPPILTDLV